MPFDSRPDRKTCSKSCRQAKARFKVRGAKLVDFDRPMKFAYSDPPYPGLARRFYGDHPDFGGEVDHEDLIHRLMRDYPDGWALSTSAAATKRVWAMCPESTRLCIFGNGPRVVKSYQPLRAYEAVLLYGGRPRSQPVAEDLSDLFVFGGRQHSHPGALPGMKPAGFCEWVFKLLGATVGDELDDLFPGSGAVARAWALFTGEDAAGVQLGLPVDSSPVDADPSDTCPYGGTDPKEGHCGVPTCPFHSKLARSGRD